MKLNPKAIEYLPKSRKNGKNVYLAIAAHQDDIEIMAYHGISKAYDEPDSSFIAVVTTDGAGSARSGEFSTCTDEQMKEIRIKEQEDAAEIGHYGKVYLLGYPSSETKKHDDKAIIRDYAQIIKAHHPKVIYTHNLADKHDTHIGVVNKVISAIRTLPLEFRPEKIYGCEVWRDLDWVKDEDKVIFDVSAHPELGKQLLSVFRSQIAGGKRYDLATEGRRLANATYCASHSVDAISAASYAIDLTPLIQDDTLDVVSFIEAKIKDFLADVLEKVENR